MFLRVTTTATTTTTTITTITTGSTQPLPPLSVAGSACVGSALGSGVDTVPAAGSSVAAGASVTAGVAGEYYTAVTAEDLKEGDIIINDPYMVTEGQKVELYLPEDEDLYPDQE